MDTVFEVKLAGHIIRYSFLKDETLLYFRNYIKASRSKEYDIRMSEERFAVCRRLVPQDRSDGYTEDKGLAPLTSSKLLEYDCCLFHGVAILYKGKAWILTAPSGTGKTTQYMNWKKLDPDNVQMICGDMPAIEKKDEELIVHYSPWNGKECIGSHLSASLGGVFLLSQAKDNRIIQTDAEHCIIDIIHQFIAIPADEKEIVSLLSMVECLFQRYPIHIFENDGTSSSTKVLVDKIDSIFRGIK